jgi:hypothetical protein
MIDVGSRFLAFEVTQSVKEIKVKVLVAATGIFTPATTLETSGDGMRPLSKACQRVTWTQGIIAAVGVFLATALGRMARS